MLCTCAYVWDFHKFSFEMLYGGMLHCEESCCLKLERMPQRQEFEFLSFTREIVVTA